MQAAGQEIERAIRTSDQLHGRRGTRVTGLTEKAIRRRIERGTLVVGLARAQGHIRISHRALQMAGLVDNHYKRSRTSQQIERLRDELVAKRSRLSEANNGGTDLSRAERLVVLGAWTEAELTRFDDSLGVWVVDAPDS